MSAGSLNRSLSTINGHQPVDSRRAETNLEPSEEHIARRLHHPIAGYDTVQIEPFGHRAEFGVPQLRNIVMAAASPSALKP